MSRPKSDAQAFFERVRAGETLLSVAQANGMSIGGVANALRRAGYPTSFIACIKAGVAVDGAVLARRDPQPRAERGPQRLCWKGYASILRMLQIKPRCYSDIATAIGAGLLNVRKIVNRMHHLQLVHVCGWEKRAVRGQFQALWAFGAGADAIYPGTSARPLGAERSKGRPELIAFAHIMRALVEPVTRAELQAATGATAGNLARLIAHCKVIRLVRVAAWDTSRASGAPAEALQIGSQQDAPRPVPMTRSEIQRRNRQARAAKAQAKQITEALMAWPAVSAACEPALEAA